MLIRLHSSRAYRGGEHHPSVACHPGDALAGRGGGEHAPPVPVTRTSLAPPVRARTLPPVPLIRTDLPLIGANLIDADLSVQRGRGARLRLGQHRRGRPRGLSSPRGTRTASRDDPLRRQHHPGGGRRHARGLDTIDVLTVQHGGQDDSDNLDPPSDPHRRRPQGGAGRGRAPLKRPAGHARPRPP